MKIKTKLYISLYLSVCTMLVVMMALYWSYRKHNKADENEGLVVEIQKAIFERTILRDEYILYQEGRAKSEWQKKSEYAGRLMDLASKRFKDDMSKAILDEMHRNYDNTVAIFSKIVENRERKDLNDKEKALSSEYEDRLISQILLKAYALSNAAQELRESNSRRSEIALKRMNLLIVIFVVAVMIVAFVNLVWLNRLLGKRLETIRKGTKIIGGGNLDYKIDLRSKDEFEDLSNEFNTMSDKLKKSFVSVENLEKEITGRKRTEEALRESEERSRSLIETSPDVIVLIDFSGKIIVINEAALTAYGYESRDELIGRSVLDFVIPEDRPRVLQEISKVLGVKTLRNLEFTSLKKDGSTFSIEVSASLILDAQQKPTSIVIMIRDITERKKAEEALRDSEAIFRAIFDNANDGILLADEETKKFYTGNNIACQMLGYSLEEIKKLGVTDIHPKEVLPYVLGQFEKQVRREIAVAKDLPVKRKDGSIFYADVNTSLVTLAGRTYLLGIFRNVTEHKRAEEEREKLIHELQDALGKIQTLSGLLPICAWCKKIRDDEGYWNQLETYIGDHSEAEFTHSICPECMKKHDPDFADNKNKEVIKENIK